MEVKTVPLHMFITRIEEHGEYKERLLSLIDKMPESSYEGVTKTDWNLPKDTSREYLNVFYQEILCGKNKYIEEQTEFYKSSGLSTSNGWYQQYTVKSNHVWHRHGQANFTNVYFLELPNKDHVTEIKDVEYDAGEGYLITFPATMLHRCKVVSGGRKTIISFNSSLL
jgi:hypothetical protein